MNTVSELLKEVVEILDRNGYYAESVLVNFAALQFSEMLAALENLLAVHEGEGGTEYHAGDIARAAIKKARGDA